MFILILLQTSGEWGFELICDVQLGEELFMFINRIGTS